MDFKRLISHFTYRIEAKPGGGFVAHATDPALPPLEAPTREELQRKIQVNISAALAAEFPQSNIPPNGHESKLAFHIERKIDGSLAIHSYDPSAPVIDASSHEEIESKFAEKLLGFVGKHLVPELGQALAAQGNSGDIKVFVKRKASFKINSRGTKFNSAGSTVGLIQPSNDPITPESNRGWMIVRFALAVGALGGLVYLYILRH